MANPATAMAAANIGVSAGNAVNSGIKGNRAARQADQSAQAQQDIIDLMAGAGAEGIAGLADMIGGFNNPELHQRILSQGENAATNLERIFQGAADELGTPSANLNNAGQLLNRDAMGSILGAVDALGGFEVPEIANQLDTTAGVASGRDLGVDPVATAGTFTPERFDFSGQQQLQQQAISTAQQAANRARQESTSDFAQAIQDGGQALNAQLAARGISADSGVAAQALGDFAGQAMSDRARLNNQLANQVGQLALQTGQFDVTSGQQLAGLQAQDNQFFNQLGLAANQQQFQQGLDNANLRLAGNQLQSQFDLQNAQNRLAGQQMLGEALGQEATVQSFLNQSIADLARSVPGFNISQAGALADLQQAQDARTVQGAELAASGQTQPLAILNDIFRNNYLNPQMQLLGLLDPSGLLQGALGGQTGLTDTLGRNTAAAGQGKGAATAGVTSGINQLPGTGQGKGSSAPGGTAAAPPGGVVP